MLFVVENTSKVTLSIKRTVYKLLQERHLKNSSKSTGNTGKAGIWIRIQPFNEFHSIFILVQNNSFSTRLYY